MIEIILGYSTEFDYLKKYYLSGPMTGLPEYNFPAFIKAADELRAAGIMVVGAHEVDHGVHTGAGTQPYVDYIRGDLKEELACDGIIMLPGWTKSKGASLELEIAQCLEYPVYLYNLNALVEM